MRRAGDRIPDGLDVRFEYTGDDETRGPGRLVEFERDGTEDRIVHLADDEAEDLEQRSFGRVRSRKDVEQGLALRGRRALVDDWLRFAVAFVQRPWKRHDDEEAQPVEPGVVEVAPGDAHPQQALAVAIGGSRVEVTRASERAVAVLDPFAFEAPVRACHGNLPVASD